MFPIVSETLIKSWGEGVGGNFIHFSYSHNFQAVIINIRKS